MFVNRNCVKENNKWISPFIFKVLWQYIQKNLFRAIEKFCGLLIPWEHHFYSCQCCLSPGCFLAHSILSKLQSGRFSWYFCYCKKSITSSKIFLGRCSHSQKGTERNSLPARSLSPDMQEQLFVLFYHPEDSPGRVCFSAKCRTRAWQEWCF